MGSAELDGFLMKMGVVGFYPLGIWFLTLIAWILKSFMFMGNALIAYPVNYDCLGKSEIFQNTTNENGTYNDRCSSSCATSGNWSYSVPKRHSLVASFDLVCDRHHLVGTGDVAFFAGGIVGSAFIGYLSDRFGRRIVIMVSSAIVAAIGAAMFFMQSIEMYLILRGILGVVYIGLMTQVTYKAELFPSKYRFLAVTCDPGFILGNCLLPLLAYLIPDWRLMYGGSLLLCSLLLLIILFFLPESVPWLLRMKRKKEAFEVLKKVAASRGQKLEEEEFAKIAADSDEPRKDIMRKKWDEDDDGSQSGSDGGEVGGGGGGEGFLFALKTPAYFWALLSSAILWAYANLVWVTISFSYGSFGGDRLFNFFLVNAMDIPAKILVIICVKYIQRRPSFFYSQLWSAIPLLALGLARFAFPIERSASGEAMMPELEITLPGFQIAMNFLVKLGIGFVYSINLIYIQEGFPTLLRARSYLIAVMSSRLSSLTGGYVAFYMRQNPVGVELGLGILGLCLIFLPLMIAETKDQPLPQTLGDLADMRRRTPTICSRGKGERENIEPVDSDPDDDTVFPLAP